MPISAASNPRCKGKGAASGKVKSPAIATDGRTQRRQGDEGSRRTVKSGTPDGLG